MTVTLTLSLRDRPRGPLPLRVRRMTLMMTRSPSAEGVPEVCGRTWWRDSQTLRSGGWWRPCSPSPHIWAGMLYIPDLGDRRVEDGRETGVQAFPQLSSLFTTCCLLWTFHDEESPAKWKEAVGGHLGAGTFFLFLLKNFEYIHAYVFNNVYRRNGII